MIPASIYLNALCSDANCQAGTDLIDKNTHEIRQDDDKTVYTSLDEIADDLPDSTPRFIFLSYPLTMVSRLFPPLLYKSIHIHSLTFGMIHAARWTAIRALHHDLLPPHQLQCCNKDAVRRGKRADTQHGRSEQGHRYRVCRGSGRYSKAVKRIEIEIREEEKTCSLCQKLTNCPPIDSSNCFFVFPQYDAKCLLPASTRPAAPSSHPAPAAVPRSSPPA